MTTSPPAGALARSKRAAAAIETEQSGASVRKTETFSTARFKSAISLDARTVVFDFNTNYAIHRRRDYLNVARG